MKTKQTMNTSNIGRKVNSGAYGAGEIISETDNTLTMRLDCGAEVTVNKAGNLHYIDRPQARQAIQKAEGLS